MWSSDDIKLTSETEIVELSLQKTPSSYKPSQAWVGELCQKLPTKYCIPTGCRFWQEVKKIKDH